MIITISNTNQRIITAVLLLIVIWAAWPADLYFVNDDYLHIPLSAQFSFGQTHLFRPVSEFTLWMDYYCWGKNAAGYHVTNLALHLTNSWLLFRFSKLFFTQATGWGSKQVQTGAWLVAVLFLIYPFHAETIFWILGRGASLSVLWLLLSLICYLQINRKPWLLFISYIFFLLALFSYETSFVFPLLVLVIAVMIAGLRYQNIRYLPIAGYFVLLAGVLFLRYQLTGKLISSYEGAALVDFNIPTLLSNANKLFARSFILPLHSTTAMALLYALLLLLLLFVFYVLYRLNKNLLKLGVLLLCCFFISILPVLSIGIDTHDSEGGRFLYLPAVFVILFFLMCVIRIIRSAELRSYLLAITGFYYIVLLITFSHHYKRASFIAATTVKQLPQQGSFRHIYLQNIPTQYEGAFIFRGYFEYTLQWMRPQLQFKQLIIMNKKEILHRAHEFTVLPETRQETQVLKSTDNKSYDFINGSDLLLVWTDSTLQQKK